jgi:hypothetical protein
MGLDRRIPIPAGITVSWDGIVTALRAAGESPVIRMIDNMPAFPDETPAENWADVRVGLTGGMVTIRRNATELTCVCWGTNDAALIQSFETAVSACKKAVASNE